MDMRNFINLIGFLGKDAKIVDFEFMDKATKQMVAARKVELSLATHNLRTPTWHTVIGRGDFQIEHLSPLKKGAKLMVTGYLKYDEVQSGERTLYYPKIMIQTFEIMNRDKQSARAA